MTIKSAPFSSVQFFELFFFFFQLVTKKEQFNRKNIKNNKIIKNPEWKAARRSIGSSVRLTKVDFDFINSRRLFMRLCRTCWLHYLWTQSTGAALSRAGRRRGRWHRPAVRKRRKLGKAAAFTHGCTWRKNRLETMLRLFSWEPSAYLFLLFVDVRLHQVCWLKFSWSFRLIQHFWRGSWTSKNN